MNKQELRSAIRARKRAMTMEEIETRSDALCQKFLESDAYRRASTLYGYLPYNQEVRTWPILERAIAVGPVAEDKTALVLMPGLAFDPQGHRIGYGGGFYDKFLSREPEHPTLALCYEFQMVEKLETEQFDIPVDEVIWA